MNKALHYKEKKNIYIFLRLQGTKHLMGKKYISMMYMCVNIKTQTTNHRAKQLMGNER